MQCPLCRQRPARRSCPAVGRQICAVCCGTKRLTEIACPADCVYLVSAKAHPPAAVKKQQERDVAFAGTLMGGLASEQQELAWAILGFVSRFASDPLLRLRDEDVSDMAASFASTLQTAAKGVIYEHRPRSMAAQRLSTELKAFLDQAAPQPDRRFERSLAAALERIGAAFREGSRWLGETGPSVCLDAIARLLRQAGGAAAAEPGETARPAAPAPQRSSLIIP